MAPLPHTHKHKSVCSSNRRVFVSRGVARVPEKNTGTLLHCSILTLAIRPAYRISYRGLSCPAFRPATFQPAGEGAPQRPHISPCIVPTSVSRSVYRLHVDVIWKCGGAPAGEDALDCPDVRQRVRGGGERAAIANLPVRSTHLKIGTGQIRIRSRKRRKHFLVQARISSAQIVCGLVKCCTAESSQGR